MKHYSVIVRKYNVASAVVKELMKENISFVCSSFSTANENSFGYEFCWEFTVSIENRGKLNIIVHETGKHVK